MNTRSTWIVRRAATANGPTSASDGVRTPPVRMIVWSLRPACVQDIRHRDGVGHDGQAGDVDEPPGESVSRGSGGDADRHAGHDQRGGRVRDRFLLGLLETGLGGEPGLEQGAARQGRGTAVDLLEQAAVVEQLEVAADSHVGDAEVPGELANADAAVLADALQDQGLALTGKHVRRVLPQAAEPRSLPPSGVAPFSFRLPRRLRHNIAQVNGLAHEYAQKP